MKISKRKLSSLVDKLRNFLETCDKASKYLKIPLPKPKIDIEPTNSRNNLFAHDYKDIIEYPTRQTRLSYRYGNKIFCVFSIKKFNYRVINL